MKYLHSIRLLRLGMKVLVGLLLSTFISQQAFAAPPAWWTSRNVIDPAKTPDDYAVVNQGQAKHIAKQAYLELGTLPNGAGSALDAIIASWSVPNASRDDFAALNIGQLKALALPFYNRLIQVGYTDALPWTGSEGGEDNYAAANVGQLKNLFSFELGIVPNQLPAWWIEHFFPGQSGILPGGDEDGDGLSNLQEFQQETHPGHPNGPDTDVDGLVDATEPVRGAQVGPKDHPAVMLHFKLSN